MAPDLWVVGSGIEIGLLMGMVVKGQDIVLLFKLISLHGKKRADLVFSEVLDLKNELTEMTGNKVASDAILEESLNNPFSVRALADQTGISKSQISLSLNRCIDIGLAKLDRKTLLPKTNSKALIEFVTYGIKYVFPAKSGEVTRGISTSFAAPILLGQLMTSGDLPPVWPDPQGKTKGVAIEPLFKNIGVAARNDAVLYAMLALTDSIRIGQPRERNLAIDKINLLVKELL